MVLPLPWLILTGDGFVLSFLADQEQGKTRAGKAAETDMQTKFNVKFNAIDKAPFKTATKPVIAEFANTMGLTDLLSEINNVK